MDDVLKLWELQNLIKEEKLITRDLKNLPEINVLKKLKEEIEFLQMNIKEKIDKSKSLKKKLKETEDEISTKKEKLGKLNDEIYSSNDKPIKELEAAQIKLNSIVELINITEEKAMTWMDRIDCAEREIKELMEELDKKKEAFRLHNQIYQTRKNTINDKLKDLHIGQAKLTSIIKPENLEEYHKLSSRFENHDGIVKMKKDICTGCHMALALDALKKIKDHPMEIYCDNCGRLLIAD